MNTQPHLSSRLVERVAQVPRSLRAYQSLEYDPTTSVISIVTENLATNCTNEAIGEVVRKRTLMTMQRLQRNADCRPIELLRRFSV